MNLHVKCSSLSWGQVYALARILSHKISRSGYKPDIIIGIARGGLIPARIICDLLMQNEVLSVRTEHWNTASKLDAARIKFSLPKEADISDKNVLVVDDVADTGDSICVLMDYLKKMGPREIRTAVLQYKISSHHIPDYWGEKIREWNWIIYPWAIYEDLLKFLEDALDHPMTTEEIRKDFKTKYNIIISRKELSCVLEDFQISGKILQRRKNKKTLWEKVE